MKKSLIDMLKTPAERSGMFLEWQRDALSPGGPANGASLADAFSVSATAFACTNYAASALSNVPLIMKVGDTTSPLDAYVTSRFKDLLFRIDASVLIWGIAYVRKIRNQSNTPVTLQWLNPMNITANVDGYGTVQSYQLTNENIKLPVEDVITFRSFSPFQDHLSDVVPGLSQFEVAMTTIASDKSLIDFAAAFFFNRMLPEGMLINPDATDDELDEDRRQWRQIFRGARKAWRALMTNVGWQWVPFTTNPKDVAMHELKQIIREDICMVFNINPALLGVIGASDALSASATYESIQRNYLITFALPRLERYLHILNSQWAAIDFNSDYSLAIDRINVPALSVINDERVNSLTRLLELGVITSTFARKLLGITDEDAMPGFDMSGPNSGALALWQANSLRLNEFRELIGLPPDQGDTGNMFFAEVEQAFAPSTSAFDIPGLQAPLSNPAPAFTFSPSLSISGPSESGVDAVDRDHTENVVRANDPIEVVFALNFAGNQFVRTAMREFDDNYSGPVSIQYVNDSQYICPLMRCSVRADVVPRFSDFVPAATRFSVEVAGIEYRDGGLLLTFENSDELTALYEEVADFAVALGAENIVRTDAIVIGSITEPVENPDDLAFAGAATIRILVSNAFIMRDAPLTVLRSYKLAVYSEAARRELVNWRHKVNRKGASTPFVPVALQDTELYDYVADGLLRQDVDVDELFDTAVRAVSGDEQLYYDLDSPEVRAYWRRFDSLPKIVDAIAQAWSGYMEHISPIITAAVLDDNATVPDEFPEETLFVDEVIGTAEEPGPLSRVVLAGMAAGQEAIQNETAADPGFQRDGGPVMELAFDVSFEQAIAFLRVYGFDLIRGINETTASRVRALMTQYISGEITRSDLETYLTAVFDDPVRARSIAQTEGMRAYNEGANERFRQSGVVQESRWQTVRDTIVCPICRPMHGATRDIQASAWQHIGGSGQSAKYAGKRYSLPAHPNCRCFPRPVLVRNT